MRAAAAHRDDSSIARGFVALALEELDVDLVTAGTLAEAREQLAQQRFAAVITDLDAARRLLHRTDGSRPCKTGRALDRLQRRPDARSAWPPFTSWACGRPCASQSH